MARLVWPTYEVSRILRVDPTTLIDWKREGRLVPDHTDTVPFGYTTATLTTFLRDGATGFSAEPPPTFTDLTRGSQRLFTARELESVLGLSQTGVSWQTVHGNLPHLLLGRRLLRYPSGPIKKILSAVSKEDAARILGSEPSTIRYLVRDKKLERQNVPGHGTALFVTRESLHTYLADRLADCGIPVHVWWEDQLTHDDAMLSPFQIRDILRVTGSTVDKFLTSGRLPFIRTPGGFRLVPERYVRAFAEKRIRPARPPIRRKVEIGDVSIAALFAVMPRVAKRWVREGAFCGGQHDDCRLIQCVRQFIADHRTNMRFTVEDWIGWASPGQDNPLVDAEGMIDPDEPALTEALRDGRLRGVWSPDKRLVVFEPDLRRFLHWYERRIFGPEY